MNSEFRRPQGGQEFQYILLQIFTMRRTVLEHSKGFQWADAVLEWEWIDWEDLGEPRGRCVCGAPIRYTFTVRNRITEATLVLGSECVKQFPSSVAQSIRGADSWKEVEKAPTTHRMNSALIQLFRRQGVLSAPNEAFYLKHHRTRPGSNRFVDARIAKLNLEVVAMRDSARPNCLCDPKRYRVLKADLRQARNKDLFYRCRRDPGCGFFQWAQASVITTPTVD